jgi:capsid protein
MERCDTRTFAPVRSITLLAGEEIQMASPTRPGNTFEPFQQWNYRRVAAALNYPYEHLVKNWAGLSFAGGRLGSVRL